LTPPPDRDAALDRILQRFAIPAEPSVDDEALSEACLDAETVAAMADGGLTPSEQAVVAEHALTCARCREVIAAVIRTTPEPPARRVWWQLPSLRWLAPALATGLAVAVWVAVGGRQSSVPPVAVQAPTPQKKVAVIPSAEPPEARADAEPARKALPEATVEPPKQETPPEKTPVRGQGGSVDAPTDNQGVRRERSKSAGAQDQFAAATPKEAALEKRAAGGAAAAEALPAPVPPLASPAPSARAPQAPPAANVVGGVAGGRQGLARRTEGFADRAAASTVAESVPVAIPDIASPDPRTRWRISGASVQRSTDNGETWTPQETGTSVRLTAGSSPNPDICWIVGDQGTVLVSVDGRSWQRLKPPDPMRLVSVSATSADAATVMTSDGRTFATTDRGQTWEARL
jgi:hypothetical protein